MKHLKSFGVFVLLLLLLLPGCSTEALIDWGVDKLDQIFAGDRDTPRAPIVSPSAPDSQPDPAAREPEEPAQFPEAVEPSIPASGDQTPAGQEPSVPTPPSEPAAPAASSGNVTASHADVTFFGPGESFKYLPKGTSGVYACTYASGDESIASVDPDTGKVTAVGPGTTKVTMHVECNGQYDFECIVRCNWKADDKEPALPTEGTGAVTASHYDATFFSAGESFKYLPKGTSGVYACTYASQDPSVATVDSDGKVTAVGPGTTKVTMHVECNGQYDFECIVRCSWTS